jgi:hypothetical protein
MVGNPFFFIKKNQKSKSVQQVWHHGAKKFMQEQGEVLSWFLKDKKY